MTAKPSRGRSFSTTGVALGDATDVLVGSSALIIDDSAERRLLLRQWLARAGMHVSEASTGAEGLESARQQPDLIVADVRLSDMSGLEVTAELKADPLTRDIPVIQRSSVDVDDSARVEGLAAGADAYLAEPIREDVLVATATSLLRHREVSRQLELAMSLDETGVYDWAIPTGMVRWSESLERIYGFDPGGFGGTFDDFAATIHPDDRERIAGEIAVALESAETIGISFRFVRTDGSVGWIESRGRIFRDVGGQPARLLGLAHDVTRQVLDRQRIDQLRRLASSLASARTTKRVMAIVMSELEGSNVEVQLVPHDEPATGDVSFSYLTGDHRLDVRMHPAGPSAISRRQATAIGELAGGALDRAFQFEAERENAVAFQRALLPPSLPRIPGWNITAEYVPASSDDRLGGDFYDVMPLDDEFVVVIGDVAGHGLAATRQMGTVRTLLRTLGAAHDGEPALVVDRARALFDRVCGRASPFVTVLVVRVGIQSGTVEIASAGHPPPILGTGDEVDLLDVAPVPPLGVRSELPIRTTVLRLGPDDWLALYTDGVFEARSMPIDESIGSIGRELAGGVDATRLIVAGEAIAELNLDDRAAVVLRPSSPDES